MSKELLAEELDALERVEKLNKAHISRQPSPVDIDTVCRMARRSLLTELEREVVEAAVEYRVLDTNLETPEGTKWNKFRRLLGEIDSLLAAREVYRPEAERSEG